MNEGHLRALEKSLFCYDRLEDSTEAKTTELIELQNKISDLLADMTKGDSQKKYLIDPQKIEKIMEKYPFLFDITSKTPGSSSQSDCLVKLTTSKMPFYVGNFGTDPNSIVYATAPFSDFSFLYNPHGTPKYSFRNKTLPINETFDGRAEGLDYTLLFSDHENEPPVTVSSMNFRPVDSTNDKMAHPHTSTNTRNFSSICYGNNPIHPMAMSGMVKTSSDFYQFIRYVLTWMYELNAEDWYGTHCTEEFKNHKPPMSRHAAQEIAEVFLELHNLIHGMGVDKLLNNEVGLSQSDMSRLSRLYTKLNIEGISYHRNPTTNNKDFYYLEGFSLMLSLFEAREALTGPDTNDATCLLLLYLHAYNSMIVAFIQTGTLNEEIFPRNMFNMCIRSLYEFPLVIQESIEMNIHSIYPEPKTLINLPEAFVNTYHQKHKLNKGDANIRKYFLAE